MMKVDSVQVDDAIGRLVKHAAQQGWTVTASGTRVRFCNPDGSVRPVFVPSRCPQGKDLKAVLAQLHRAGLDDMPGGNERYQERPDGSVHAEDLLRPERAGREGDSQQLPVPNDELDIQSQVIADITARRELGIRRYGTALQPHNGRSALQDLYEELVDAAMYAKQRLVEDGDAEDRKAWQVIAEDLERQLADATGQLRDAVARAEKAEGRLATLRAALAGD